MTYAVPVNQTVSYSVYKEAVTSEAKITADFARANISVIDRAFNAGEPVWMCAEELKLRFYLSARTRPHKTPRQLAVRVVKF